MLTKLKSEKSKITDLKLGEAFLITKYAAKFMVNEKELLASWEKWSDQSHLKLNQVVWFYKLVKLT